MSHDNLQYYITYLNTMTSTDTLYPIAFAKYYLLKLNY